MSWAMSAARGMRTWFLLGMAGLWIAGPLVARAEEVAGKNSKITLGGVGWVTYRYDVQDEEDLSIPGQRLGTDDRSRFDIDRVYFSADYAVTERYIWHTIFEATNFNGELDLFLKQAYLNIKEPFGASGVVLRLGQMPHVMTGIVEKTWGYRIVAQTPIDRYFGISTTWLGAGATGSLAEGALVWDAAIANERSYNRTTSSRYETFQGRMTVVPVTEGPASGLSVSGFAQYAAQPAPSPFPFDAGKNNILTWELFPAFSSDRFTAALEVVQQKRERSVLVDGEIGSEEVTSRLVGGFARAMATRRIEGFVRIDRLDPNTDGDAEDDGLTAVMAGLSHRYDKNLRSILDVEFVKYDEPEGADFEQDVTVSARVEVTL